MNVSGLSLRDLEYVVAVAENLHFGRAALSCSVSQPTLSAQIRKLEDWLGFDIFERAPRQVLVTERGQHVVAQARIILGESRRLLELAQAGGEPLSGTFRLGVISTLGPYLLPLLLKPLREAYPKLRLLLTEGLTWPLLTQLEQGQLDAVLASGAVKESDLTELPVFFEEFVLAVPRDHALATVESVSAADIKAEELILLNEGHCLRDQMLHVCPARERGVRPGDPLQASGLETLRQMVGAGIGCSLLPRLSVAVGALLDDMVAYRRLQADVEPGRTLSLFHRQSFGRIRDVRLLREAIRSALEPTGLVRLPARTGV
ncbi:LysR family transcriptional regulator [Rhodovarius crocodyli]|uniref:LysR family transcriptional regulator n=1 Tax=Rhodovarius crocodyli TaxID=1979269 RepID=A0A437LZ02_9PROT|nr:LysR substrate-binding domain-containing protein [Rhodovarius crocodyli]RVT90622.1 LysR family transcriptional regulator [Rhodovarius crocodyli]